LTGSSPDTKTIGIVFVAALKAENSAFFRTMDHRDNARPAIARIAWARRKAYHRPVNNGCNTMIAKKIQKSAEKSNAITQPQ
jgi:hypothetical protein